MTPDYLRQLADIADPDKLWQLFIFDQMDLPPEKRLQLDAGVALRRYASHLERLGRLLEEKKSLLITPLGLNTSASMTVDTPPNHENLRTQK